MDRQDHEVMLGGRRLLLCHERAAFDVEAGRLFVADLHWGKDQTFRSRGVPLPAGDLDAELATLSGLVDRLEARELVVLGDLVHARDGITTAVRSRIAAWFADHPDLRTTLVAGNHDRALGDTLPDGWRLDLAPDASRFDGLLACHEPPDRPAGRGPTLAGHLHPTARLRSGGDQLRLPCFVLRGELLLLPAFTMFSHGVPFEPSADSILFVIAGDELLRLTVDPG